MSGGQLSKVGVVWSVSVYRAIALEVRNVRGTIVQGEMIRGSVVRGAVTQGNWPGTLSLDAFIRWKQFLRKCICSITFIYCTIKNYSGQSNFVNRIKSIFPKRTIDKSASIREVTYSIGVFRSLSNI